MARCIMQFAERITNGMRIRATNDGRAVWSNYATHVKSSVPTQRISCGRLPECYTDRDAGLLCCWAGRDGCHCWSMLLRTDLLDNRISRALPAHRLRETSQFGVCILTKPTECDFQSLVHALASYQKTTSWTSS